MSIATRTGPSSPTLSSRRSLSTRALSLLYSGLAYLIFLGTFLYAVGFISQYGVPKTIDSGPPASFAIALLINLGLMLLFVVQHSGMARRGLKRLFARFAPRAIERSTYLLLTSLTLILLFWQWKPIPMVVWDIENSTIAALTFAAGFLGWLTVLYSTFLVSHFEPFALTQLLTNLAGRITAPMKFKTPGLYRVIRDLIYLGFIIAFWSAPRMTLGHLLLASVTTAYIFVGIFFEERNLISSFRDEYQRYRARVAMLLPDLF
jgi:methanethiol S-methyltransferase